MTRKMSYFGSALLLSVLINAGLASASAAGTLVKVTFGGNGFSGSFEYDQSCLVQSTSPGTFFYPGSGLTYNVCYVVGSPPCKLFASPAGYTITTSANGFHTFTLKATAPAGTNVTIVLPMSSGVTLSSSSLPFCSSFPSTPNTGSMFMLSGGNFVFGRQHQ